MRIYCTLLSLLVIFGWMKSTVAQVSIGNEGTIEECSNVLVDTGGDSGPYSANEDFTITICPEAPDTTIWIEWVIFDLDLGSSITVYDGPSDGWPPLGQWTMAQLANSIQQPSIANASGCLTVSFTSGPNSTGDFAASIHCGQPCAVPVPVLNPGGANPLKVCPGEEVEFDGSNSYSIGGSDIELWEFDWDGDGEIDEAQSVGQASHVFEEAGIYRVQMHVMDGDSCASNALTNHFVYVSTDAIWQIDPVSLKACTQEPVELSVDITGDAFTLLPGVDFGGGLFIPDEAGSCFTSDITFNQFVPGQVIENADLTVASLFINFEHSWMADLTVSFICPNGQSIMVHQQGGGGTFLGEPIDIETSNEPGIGYDYYWSPDATNGTWADNDDVMVLPSGTYECVQPFSNLEGCPLNGVWQLEICDLLFRDNGFVFDWAIAFTDSIYPSEFSFTPLFGLECDSTYWTTDDDSNVLLAGDWDCADLTVTNPSPGVQTYTAHAINNHGCEYTQDVEVEYVAFSAAIDVSNDLYCGGIPVEMSANVLTESEGDAIYIWGPGEYFEEGLLTDTLGESVFVQNIVEPTQFTLTVAQTFDDYDGLLCEATTTQLINTCEVTIPNVVSPYGSTGTNDKFTVPGIQAYQDVHMVIYNRWGTVVFEHDDFGESPVWDCAADNASSGTYYYKMTVPIDEGSMVVTDVNGVEVEYPGPGPLVFQGMIQIVD